ncbi:MAG: hypothetical protein Q8R02_07430 [Hyphomonadaceae bacterium]|nr:hypothetical protein [Hyphomonadaceae bacterium]
MAAGPAWGQQAQGAPPPPDGVDYLMAVQCSALNSALAVFQPNNLARNDDHRADRFRAWAEMRAAEAKQNPAAAAKDIAASRKDYLAEAGSGPNEARRARLFEIHLGQWRSCDSLSGVDDIVIVGG